MCGIYRALRTGRTDVEMDLGEEEGRTGDGVGSEFEFGEDEERVPAFVPEQQFASRRKG